MSFHALLYCERLFYLEEVEEIRVADFACLLRLLTRNPLEQYIA